MKSWWQVHCQHIIRALCLLSKSVIRIIQYIIFFIMLFKFEISSACFVKVELADKTKAQIQDQKIALRYLCNMGTVTTINNDFLAIECYTSSSNGIHLITLFSGCRLASGIPDCWVLSLYLASRNPVNLKITEPEEHFNGCWNEHLFRQQCNFLPLINFPGALLATHQVLTNCCLLSFTSCGALPPVPTSCG